MAGHQVLSVAAMLRDHLAAHDRPLAFLFGAGTSCCVNGAPLDPVTGKASGFTPLIPGVIDLTKECAASVDLLGAPQTAAWSSLVAECGSLGLAPNIESILGRVRSKVDALYGADVLCGLGRSQWIGVDDAIRKRIAELATPTDIPQPIPHQDFTRWIRNTTRRCPIEVFTTNYDLLFERTFDQLRVPHFDGFVGSQHPYFSPECVENDALLPSPTWIRYWKLHGSVTWAIDKVATEERISRGKPTKSGEMVLPSHRKYDESRKQPYRALMDRLGRVLARPDALLVVCGFSFGDQHINAIILDALERHPKTHLIALTYTDISANDVVSTWATALPNVLHIGRNAAALRGKFDTWTYASKPDAHMTAATGGLATPSSADPSQVECWAGDFNAFTKFLAGVGA